MSRIALLAVSALLVATVAVAGAGGGEPASDTGASLLVRGDPEDLVVQLEALPSGFQMVGEDSQSPNEYSVVYFHPEALVSGTDSGTNLLAVVVNLGIYEDAAAAGEQFTAQGSMDRDSIMEDIREASEGATPIAVQPYTVQVEGSDQVLAFGVEYAIGSTHLFEYRYRFIVGNALANVVITALASEGGDEPSALPDRARALVEEQAARLNSARS
ncbi:MAG: hypothetical protein OEV52_01350 [Dehalococcoidia bacterium]|nr:hypothetical protein [Dehalococcoidia bacterium]